MKLITALTALLIIQTASAAPYYRFWRGEKLRHLNESRFMNILARDFMPQAPKLFPHLESYLVSVPPIGTGVDEVALLAYTNEEEYLRARNTPEGRGYGDAHWEIFERETSKSLVPKPLIGRIEAENAYDVLNRDVQWEKGATFFYMGERREGLSTSHYLREIDKHVKAMRKEFGGRGMNGYVILVTEDREYAWMNFDSENQAKRLFASPAGRRLSHQAGSLMKTVLWTKNEAFKRRAARGGAYTVK